MGSRGPPRRRTEFQAPQVRKSGSERSTISVTPGPARSLLQVPVHDSPSSVLFAPFSSREIRKLSVCRVDNPESFNQLWHPNPGGLYDLRMGPFSDRGDLSCGTCLLRSEHCPGHLGHVELPLPVVNPLYIREVLQALKLSCLACHRLRVPDYSKELMLVQQKLLDRGLIIGAQRAADVADVESLSLEDEVEGSRRRSKSAADDVAVVERLRRFYEEEVAEDERRMEELALKSSAAVAAVGQTRNVQELKKRYRKEFVAAGKAGKGACRHCGARTKSVKIYRSR